jgi:hypothetical protein
MNTRELSIQFNASVFCDTTQWWLLNFEATQGVHATEGVETDWPVVDEDQIIEEGWL